MTPDELIAVITRGLDADEQAARAATPGPWRVVNVTDYKSATVDGADVLQDGGYDETTKARRQVMRPLAVIPPDVDYGPTVDLADATHIARHGPARVLADVESKREILAQYDARFSDDFVWQPILAAMARPHLGQESP